MNNDNLPPHRIEKCIPERREPGMTVFIAPFGNTLPESLAQRLLRQWSSEIDRLKLGRLVTNLM